ncbi:MAG: hypothetical protein ACHQ49_16770 [Elusimicrobiota bacterium]
MMSESEVEFLPITIRLSAFAAPARESSLYLHSVEYSLDIPEGQSTVKQLRSLRRLQRSVLRALKDLLTRLPEEGARPTIYFRAKAGTYDHPSDEFSFAMEHDRERRGHNVRWRMRDGKNEIGHIFCSNPAAVIRKARSIMLPLTSEWLFNCPRAMQRLRINARAAKRAPATSAHPGRLKTVGQPKGQ